MKVNLLGSIYRNKVLKKGLEFASDNGALFSAATALTLSTVARPIAIYSTPKTDKENRKLACAKSYASSLVGFGLMLGVTHPLSQNIKKINNNPENYLNKNTINTLKNGSKSLLSSKGYQFGTQLFKLGIGAVVAIPKAVITCALIPPIMALTFKTDKNNPSFKTNKNNSQQTLTFTGNIKKEPIAKGISKVLNNKKVQSFINKHKDSNYPMHITALTDTLATSTFILQTQRNKNIKEERKNVLCANAGIATGLSTVSGYILDKALNKPTEKFIENFKLANAESPKLDKYVEGIKIAKPALILGSIYYCAIPFISTFFAEKTNKNNKQPKILSNNNIEKAEHIIINS